MVNTTQSPIAGVLDSQKEKVTSVACEHASHGLSELDFVLWQNRIMVSFKLETAKDSYERLASRIRNVIAHVETVPAQIHLVRDYVDEVICNFEAAARYAASVLENSAEIAQRKSNKQSSPSEKNFNADMDFSRSWLVLKLRLSTTVPSSSLDTFCAAIKLCAEYEGTEPHIREVLVVNRDARLTDLLTELGHRVKLTETNTQSALAEAAKILEECQ